MSDANLIPIETVNAPDLFSGENLDALLKKIRQHTEGFEASVDTEKNRKNIASLAYKISRSKTAIDNAGKDLAADWKKKVAAIDAQRKRARDYLDALRDEVRRPLTDWETEQERIAEEAREAERQRLEEEERKRKEAIEAKERELREREAEIARKEAKAREIAEAERKNREQADREERIRKEAEERAKREAADAIARAEKEAREAKERAEREALEAAAREAAAAQRAEEERQAAIQREKERALAEQRERERKAAEKAARDKAEEDRRIADRKHRLSVNAAAAKALEEEGFASDQAERLVTLIASGAIPGISVNY